MSATPTRESRTELPWVSPFATPELVNGVYPTTACLNDAARDTAWRDAWYAQERKNLSEGKGS